MNKNLFALNREQSISFGAKLFDSLNRSLSALNVNDMGNFPQIRFHYGKCGRNWLWVYNCDRKVHRGIYRFKIHLQVNKEYCIDFMGDLLVQIINREGFFENLELIAFCKITSSFRMYSRNKGVPVSVFYLPYNSLLSNKNYRQQFLDAYVRAFVKFSEDWCSSHNLDIQKVAFSVEPRFNLKINPIVYIAGGDGGVKLKGSVEGLIDDKIFYKGFEYSFDPEILKGEDVPAQVSPENFIGSDSWLD